MGISIFCVNADGNREQCELPIRDNDIAQLAYNAGFRGYDLVTMVALVLAESGGVPNIANSAGAVGLVQILQSAHPEVSVAQAIDPQFALNYAYKLFKNRGNFCDWESWEESCGRGFNGSYRIFLDRATSAVTHITGVVPVEPGTNPPSSGNNGSGNALSPEDMTRALRQLYDALRLPWPFGQGTVPDSGRTYTVKAGDTLYAIARDELGDANRWQDLYNANKETIGPDPSNLQEGEVLTLP